MPATPVPFRSHVRTVDDLRGPAGRLEAVLNTGRDDAPYAAVLAHPHPLGGGTLHNKVVYHAAKAFAAFGVPVLRFNFRGTGLSEGTHDHGVGEVDDVRAAMRWAALHFGRPLLFAGFSFGSFVGFQAVAEPREPAVRIAGAVGIGLPVHAEGRDYTWEFLATCPPVPKLFIAGDTDQYAPRGVLEATLRSVPGPNRIVTVEGADHFFAGTATSPASKLEVYRAQLVLWLAESFGAQLS